MKYHHFHFSPSGLRPAAGLSREIGAGVDVLAGAGAVRGAGAGIDDLVGAVDATGAATDVLSCAGATAAEGPRARAMIVLAAAVPSAPQTGQATVHGMAPPTGSTSKEYFWPQPHWTLTSIIAAFQFKFWDAEKNQKCGTNASAL